MRTPARQAESAFLYVVSWEVCNRLGGVYTVLESSAPHLRAFFFGEEMLYIGPDLWADRAAQAQFLEDPVQPEVAAIAMERDVPVRFGRWNVPGQPPCALVDFGRMLERKNALLGDLWNQFGVDSIHADWDTVERVLFGYAAGKLIELHYHTTVRPRARSAVAHFHQWKSAAGILRLAETTPEVGTVYTPHGTALGRKLASEGIRLHTELESIEPDAEARARHVESQHTLEVAAAKEATVLACVSEHEGEEATHILGRRPDLITPNGFTPQPRSERPRDEVRAALCRTVERFLGSPVDPVATRIAISSGRYEFRNKGLDVIITALGKLKARTPPPPRPLLFLLFVSAPQTGPRPEALRRAREAELAGEPCGVCTHNLAHPENDEVVAALEAAGIANAPGDPVRVVFAPIMLDGRDPLFPLTYAEVLQSCDLSVFPSRYEPWGLTPLESLAAHVPTITTDLTGFGRFVATLPETECAAVSVLPGGVNGELATSLLGEFERFLDRSDEQLSALRRCGDDVVRRTAWERQIGKLGEALDLAVERSAERGGTSAALGLSRLSSRSVVVIPARSESRPQLYRFSVSAALPPRIARLHELARNLWWSWNAQGRALFERIAGQPLREVDDNPIRLLRSLDPQTLAAFARSKEFLAAYDATLAEFDAYLARPPADAPAIAYLCAEFAVHPSLPIYSGGLGVLAGDHLKSASDLALPLVGVGLRYSDGYFRQRITPEGRQGVEFVAFDPREGPITEVTGPDGAPVRIVLKMPERDLKAGVWRVEVGSVPLFLLDTLLPDTDPADRDITQRLYPSDREQRIRQEILLGMGGWRMLKAVGRVPAVCHLNEGHSAFVLFERLLDLVEGSGLTFAEASEVVRKSTVFTTHTPVPAGHDRFAEGLMRRYFGNVAQRLGLDWGEFYALGVGASDPHHFSMTNLALRLAGRANGVSRLHGDVSRRMSAEIWPGFHAAEAPIDSVTNGVHLATWVGPEMNRLFETYVSPSWRRATGEAVAWERAELIPDGELWQARREQRRRLLQHIRTATEEVGLRRGERPVQLKRRLEGVREEALWIGFARRFAPYKRATLLFRDPDRLAALLDDPGRPVRLVFAGKSHPDDREGADLVKTVVDFTTDPRFAGRVFFLEDYGIPSAQLLVQGVDVWLNTPTRPLEASGTSGMKACANGVIHMSVLDGWWVEGYDGGNGWTIGEGRAYESPEMQNEHDSRTLYGTLETEVVPLFFERDPDAGVPVGWLAKVKRSLATVPSFFNTHRMVGEYLRSSYAPLAKAAARLSEREFAGARAETARKKRIRDSWKDVHITNVSVTDLSRGSIGVGEVFEVRAQVQLGPLRPDEVEVELYIGPANPAGDLVDPVVIPLLREGDAKEGVASFVGAYLPRGAGSFRYGVRVMPAMESFHDSAALGLVRWA